MENLGKDGDYRERSLLPYIIFQLAFSLLLAFSEPLEGSAVENMDRMSLQYSRRMSQVSKWRHNFQICVYSKIPSSSSFQEVFSFTS